MEVEDWRADYEMLQEVPGHGLCGLHKYLFTTGLVIGLDEDGLAGRYCYAQWADAWKALRNWDGVGDPTGPWIKYKGTGGERLGPGATE